MGWVVLIMIKVLQMIAWAIAIAWSVMFFMWVALPMCTACINWLLGRGLKNT